MGYPGDVLTVSVSVDSSIRRVVRLSAEDIPSSVTKVVITPSPGVTLLSPTACVSIPMNAMPCVYPFVLKVADEATGGTAYKDNLALVVAPRKDAVE